MPGIGFAEMGPGDLSLSLGYFRPPRPLPDEMEAVRQRVRAACLANGIAFLESATPEDVIEKIDGGARVIAGHGRTRRASGAIIHGASCPNRVVADSMAQVRLALFNVPTSFI